MAISFGYEVKIGKAKVSSRYFVNGKSGEPQFQTVLPHDSECKYATATVCRRIAYELLCRATSLTCDGFPLFTKEDVDRQIERMKQENERHEFPESEFE
jgi:hypothetical protein